MLLNLICAGNALSFNNFEALFSAAGANTMITLDDAYAQPPSSLYSLLRVAGVKSLSVDASAEFYSVPQMAELISSIQGGGTELKMGLVNIYPPQSIASLISSLGGRAYCLDLDCSTINAEKVSALMAGLSGVGGATTFAAVNSMPQEALSQVLSGIVGKTVSFELDCQLSSPERTIQFIGQIASSGFDISLSNLQFIPLSQLPAVFHAAGTRGIKAVLDVEFFPAHVLKDLVGSAGQGTTIRINSAHVLSTADVLELISRAGGRRLNLVFNGRQLTVDPINGDKLQQVVAASSMNNNITVNTAQYPPLSYLLPIIESSGHTNLSLSYNGHQLSETEPHGNVVVRGIQAAQQSTSIVVTSVGARNFNLSHYLGILAAAG